VPGREAEMPAREQSFATIDFIFSVLVSDVSLITYGRLIRPHHRNNTNDIECVLLNFLCHNFVSTKWRS
jgi:hypothetical protein